MSLPSILRPHALLLIGFVVTQWFDEWWAYVVVRLVVTLVLLHRRSASGFWPYQIDSFALCLAFGLTHVFDGHSPGFKSAAIDWAVYAVVGGALVWFTRPRPKSQS